MAYPFPLPPTCTRSRQGREEGGPGENPTAPLQTKPQGTGFQEGEVHLQETEAGQSESPWEATWEKGFQEERLGQQTGVGGPQEKSWRNGTGKPSSRAAGLRQAGLGLGRESRGRGHGRAGGSCTVFWALYMRLRYS